MKSITLSHKKSFAKSAIWRRALPLLLIPVLLGSCKADPDMDQSPGGPATSAPNEYLGLVPTSANMLQVTTKGPYSYELRSTGGDPYISTTRLTKVNHPDSSVLTFEYICAAGIPDPQIFFADPITEARSLKPEHGIPASTTWAKWSCNVKKQITDFSWGAVNQYLRLDFGNLSGVTIQVRNIHMRGMTPEEIAAEEEKENQIRNDQLMDQRLASYLDTTYSSHITQVAAGLSQISVQGNFTGQGTYSLCEIPPYVDVLMTDKFEFRTPLTSGTFTQNLERYATRNGVQYDRTLSKWVIVRDGETKDVVVSHARYADQITPVKTLPAVPMLTKKGLGGFFVNEIQGDLDDLGISSVTINITLTSMMFTQPRANAVAHTYCGKTFYFDLPQVLALDQAINLAAQRNIVVAAIVLIQKAAHCPDPEVGRMLQHPSYTAEGIFTMPNMTNPESVNCYAAGLDFLAQRYSQNGGLRVHKWIMHNEVDAGLSWTNMGDKPMHVYMDAYVKSMRMCHNIVRQYDVTGEVMGSFTHSWAQPVEPRFYATKDMLSVLQKYGNAEGDFQWGLAYHPYPQDLNEPKTWLDNMAEFNMNTPLVTFKNLEVLDRWAKQSANKFQNITKRSVWLSENGTNSRSYSQTHLAEQAAGFAYAWKKIKALDGIDGIQWHNWIDNRAEGGLRIGLRKFPDEPGDPLGRKPVWFLYQAAGTSTEDALFDPYKSLIGISDWNIIQDISGF